VGLDGWSLRPRTRLHFYHAFFRGVPLNDVPSCLHCAAWWSKSIVRAGPGSELTHIKCCRSVGAVTSHNMSLTHNRCYRKETSELWSANQKKSTWSASGGAIGEQAGSTRRSFWTSSVRYAVITANMRFACSIPNFPISQLYKSCPSLSNRFQHPLRTEVVNGDAVPPPRSS